MKLINVMLLTQDGEIFDIFNTEQDFLFSPYHLDPTLKAVYSVSHDNEIYQLTQAQWHGQSELPFKPSVKSTHRFKSLFKPVMLSSLTEKLSKIVHKQHSEKRRIIRANLNSVKREKRIRWYSK